MTSQEIEREYKYTSNKNIYNTNKSRVKLEIAGQRYLVKSGVRQGDPLYPKLFKETLESILKQLD